MAIIRNDLSNKANVGEIYDEEALRSMLSRIKKELDGANLEDRLSAQMDDMSQRLVSSEDFTNELDIIRDKFEKQAHSFEAHCIDTTKLKKQISRFHGFDHDVEWMLSRFKRLDFEKLFKLETAVGELITEFRNFNFKDF